MSSAFKESSNKKRKRTESFDANLNESTAKKILKLEKTNNAYEEEIYFDNKISGSDSVKVLTHNQVCTSIKTSNFFASINKNDVLTLIWKTNFDYSLIVKNSKCISQHYISKRGDLWEFLLYYDKQTQNFKFKIKVKEMHSENQIRTSESYGLEFNLDIIMQINSPSYKSINFNNNIIEFNNEYDIQLEFLEDFTDELIDYNSEINLIFEISITKCYTKILNNEKKAIGYIGIINEAMTCYMNSMIQTLNIFGAFKKAVFDIPINDDDYNSISLSLQRLFYDLMVKETPVSTNKLISSFGWGREEMNMQHDVQEFNLLLGELMEKKMKGTPGEGTFSRLFEGRLMNYIECLNVEYKSEKEERFCDLQLTVKGCKNIYQSLDIYINEEILDNDDKYFAEGYGKQKAKKGIKFLQCPNILMLQLKRFEYNQKKEAMIKINEFFEFYEEINLDKYMYKNNSNNKSNNDPNHENIYTLHSVVVHKGSPNSGHYYAYIKPTIEDYWIQFNDEIVKPADKYEVFDNNFGGTNKYFKLKTKGEISETNYSFESNAYVLVYIKKSMRKSILNPLKLENIPKKIRERFDLDISNEIKKQNKKNRTIDDILLQIFSPELVQFFDDIGINRSTFDLSKNLPLFLDFKKLFKIFVPRFFTFSDLLFFISNLTNIPSEDLLIFEYFPNVKENFYKRSDFLLKQIRNENLDDVIEIYTKNHRNNFPILFIYSKKNYKIFKIKDESNQSIEEDFLVSNINNTHTGIIHISSTMNELEFNKNINSDHENTKSEQDNEELENDQEQIINIIFIKFLLPNKNINNISFKELINNNNQVNINEYEKIDLDHFSLRTIDIVLSTINNDHEDCSIIDKFKKQVLNALKNYYLMAKDQMLENYNYIEAIYENLKNVDFSLAIESTCLINNSSENLFIDLSPENVKEILEKNNGIILIPCVNKHNNSIETLKFDNLKYVLENTFNKIYIDLFCLTSNLPIFDKMEFDIREISDEKSIKEKIFYKIKTENLFHLIFKLSNHYILTANQETLTCEEFTKNIDLNYFDIINNRDTSGKIANMYKEIPISRFVNHTEMRIDLSFNYIQKANLSEFKVFELSIFDKDSNKIAYLSCILPRKLKKTRDIVEFIVKSNRIDIIFEYYNKDLYNFKNNNINKINPKNCFFILQHPSDCFIYHFIADENSEIFNFEGKGEFKYRMQIYDEEFIYKINNGNYCKIYLKVNLINGEDVKIDPLIIYVEKDQTNFELKLEINRNLENIRNLNKALNPNYANFQEYLQNEKNLEKVKYFKSNVTKGKLKKISSLNNYRDDDIIETIFKGERVYNLLVEISLNNHSN